MDFAKYLDPMHNRCAANKAERGRIEEEEEVVGRADFSIAEKFAIAGVVETATIGSLLFYRGILPCEGASLHGRRRTPT